MKSKILFITTLGLLTLHACSTRTDKIFTATDELHNITLYKNGLDFEMLYNGVNTAKGTYYLRGDTILLTFDQNQLKEFDPNKELTSKILISRRTKTVKSLDSKKQFCANINFDNTTETNESD